MKNVISQIVNTIRDAFEQDGFKLKVPNKFVKKKNIIKNLKFYNYKFKKRNYNLQESLLGSYSS